MDGEETAKAQCGTRMIRGIAAQRRVLQLQRVFEPGGLMTDRLSRVDFDRLIARASTLDAEGIGQLDLARARAIAIEVGISPEAWDAALLERAKTPAAPEPSSVEVALPFPSISLQVRRRLALIGIAGIVTGLVSGTIGSHAGPLALFLGGLALAVGAGLAIAGGFRTTARNTHVEVAAWWISLTLGIFVGLQNVHPDPFVFGSVGWAVSTSLAWAVRRWIRRTPAPSSLARTPSA
jgi:hypothetical protein